MSSPPPPQKSGISRSQNHYFDIPNPFEPYNVLQQHLQADIKKMQADQNKAQEKQKTQQNVQKKRTQRKPATGFCGQYFGYIMVAVFVLLLGFMGSMKMNETSYFFTSKYAEKDYYGLLGAQKSFTTRQIKSAYRKAVVQWHPDRNPDCGEECRKKMADINEAYLILLNPETRSFHDKHGTEVPEHLIKLAKEKSGSIRGGN